MQKKESAIPDKLISIQDKDLMETINDPIGNVDLEKTIFMVSDRQRNMLRAVRNILKMEI